MTDTNTVEKFATEPDQSSSNLDMISMPSGLNLDQIDYPENEVYDENDFSLQIIEGLNWYAKFQI